MADVRHDGLAALRGQLDEVDGDEGEVTEIRATFNNVGAIYLKKGGTMKNRNYCQ